MKKLILLIFVSLVAAQVFAQGNFCTTAVNLTVNTTCVPVGGTSSGATMSMSTADCAPLGDSDDDVWYQFVAVNTSVELTVTPNDVLYDPVVEIRQGSCPSPATALFCSDVGYPGDEEIINATGLTIGTTYFIRVYHYEAGSGSGGFTICLKGTSASSGATIDEACSGFLLPEVTSECNYMTFSTSGATTTATPGTPSATCTNWNSDAGPMSTTPGTGSFGASSSGGYAAGTRDVWFKIIVPASKRIVITSQPIANYDATSDTINDGVMALYTGANCGALAQVACSDDYNYPNVRYPGANNYYPDFDELPFINYYNAALNAGDTLYLRYWRYGTSASGSVFGLCVTSPTNDLCANPLYICDLDGYSAMSSGSYGADRPGNMYGNNEGAVTYNDTTNGINTGGPFGVNPAWTGLSTTYNVSIQNNSWITFTASSTTAILNVAIDHCFISSKYGLNGGVQMQIFSADNCDNFVSVSQFAEDNTTFTIEARGLIAGKVYYLMVDGFNGDICNYTISAQSGVQYPAIIDPGTLCNGSSAILDLPFINPAPTGYNWSSGATNLGTDTSITVTPLTTTSYTVLVEGYCGKKQTLTQTVNVYTPLTGGQIAFNGTTKSQTICSGGDPSNIVGTGTASAVAPTGGSGTYTYLWQYADNCDGNWIDIASSNSVSYDPPAGLTAPRCYRRKVTDASCGYKYSDSVSVSINANPSITFVNDTVCAGSTIAMNPAIIDGSGSTYTYTWSGSTTPLNSTSTQTPDFSTNTSGNYNLTLSITDNNSCVASANTSIRVHPLPVFSVSPASASVCESINLQLNATPYTTNYTGITWTGDTAPLSNTAINNPVFNSNTSGTYNLTYTAVDSNGCSNSVNKAVTVNPTPVPTINSPAFVCAGTNLTLVGSGPYTSYTWSGQTTPLNFTNIQSPTFNTATDGTYDLTYTVADALGCSGSDTVIVTVFKNPTVTIVNDSLCAGNTISITPAIVNGSGLSYTYAWTGNTAPLNSTSSSAPDFSTSTAGTYNLTLTVTDDKNCTASDNAAILVHELPVFTVAPSPATVCEGVDLQLNATPYTSNYTNIQWTGDVAYLNNTTINNPIFNSPTAAGYSLTYSATDSNGCSNFVVKAISVSSSPVPTIASPAFVCAGSDLTLDGSGPFASYSWSGQTSPLNATNVEDPIFNSATDGTYNLTYTVSNGGSCIGSDTVIVTVYKNPTVSVPLDSVCAGSDLILNPTITNGTGTVNSYVWVGDVTALDNFLSQSPTFNSTSSGLSPYVFTVTDDKNCSGVALTSVYVHPLPVYTVSPASATVCEGVDLQLSVSPYTTNYTNVQWTGDSVYLNNPFIYNPVFNASIAATYNLTYSAVDSNGCAGSVNKSVTVTSSPTPTVTSPAVVCAGSDLTLGGSGSYTTYSWSGQTAPLNDVNIQNPTFNTSTDGTYNLTYTVTNGANCVGFDTVIVTVFKNPTVSVPFDSVCSGSNLVLNPTITNGSGTVTNYLWVGDVSVLDNFTIQQPTFNSTATGSSPYVFTVTDDKNCSASAITSVYVYPLPVYTVSPASPSVCEGVDLQLSVSPYTTNYTNVQWTGDSVYLNNPFIYNPLFNAPAVGTYNLTYTATDSNSCTNSVAASVLVTGNPHPTVSGNAPVCAGSDLFLTGSGPFASYSWSGSSASLNDSTIQSPLFNNTTAGIYTLTYIVTDGSSCAGDTTLSITVNPLPLLVDTDYTNLTLCSSNDGSITIHAFGANQYSIDGGATYQADSIFTNLTFGTYQTMVMNGFNCTANGPVVTILDGSAPVAPLTSANDTICSGQNIPALMATAGAGGTLTWYDDSLLTNVVATGGNFIPATVANGANTYYVTETYNSCESDSNVVVLFVNVPGTIDAGISDTVCEGNVFNLAATYSGAVSQVLWSSPTGGTFSNVDDTVSTYTPTAADISAGNVLLTITSDDPYGPCGAISDTVRLFINKAPDAYLVSVNPNDTICEGDVVVISIQNPESGVVYTVFSDSAGTMPVSVMAPDYTIQPDSDTTVYVVAYTSEMCRQLSAPSSVFITVHPQPIDPLIEADDTAVCQGSSVTIGALPTNQIYTVYDAYTGGNIVDTLSFTVSPSVSTDYFIETSTSYGCKLLSGRDTVTININAAPVVSSFTAQGATICEGDTSVLSAIPVTYTYSIYDAPVGGNLLSDSLSFAVHPIQTTTYYLQTVDANGCSPITGRDSAVVTVNPAPASPLIDAYDDSLCLGESFMIIVSNPQANVTYLVYDETNTLIDTANTSVTPDSTTVYYVEANSDLGCKNLSANTAVPVTVLGLPDVFTVGLTPNDTVCQGTPVTISATGAGIGVSYELYDSNGNRIDTLSTIVTPEVTSTYLINPVNQFGCRNSSINQYVTIVVNPLPGAPVIDTVPAFICEGDVATIFANTLPDKSTINWYDSPTGGTLLATGDSYTTPPLNGSTTYYLYTTSPEGCVSSGSATTVIVIVRPRPVVTLTNDAVNNFIYQGQIITFTAEPYGYDTYIYSVDVTEVQNGHSNIYQTNSLTDQQVVSVAVIDNGCRSKDDAKQTITVKPLSNAFTPNSDGHNDVFLKGLDLQILNRWGQELYKGFDGWDGYYEGKKVSAGTYFYIITLKDLAGNETKLNGPVTLIGD